VHRDGWLTHVRLLPVGSLPARGRSGRTACLRRRGRRCSLKTDITMLDTWYQQRQAAVAEITVW
jgi:hypothetical protein